MGFNFEKFTKVGSNFSPTVSIRKHGAIGLSQGSLQRFNLIDGDWFIVLYYDKAANVLGIEPIKDGTAEGAVKLIKRRTPAKNGKESISSSISAKSFFEYYEIDAQETRSFKAFFDAETKMIIVNLNEPIKTEKEDDEPEMQ